MAHKIEWVDPEMFLTHNGVSVYHIYVNDDVSKPTRPLWFGLWVTVSDSSYNGEDGRFDVQDLPEVEGCSESVDSIEGRKARIRQAIERNAIAARQGERSEGA